MDVQTGVEIYQFICARLEDLRDKDYPAGEAAYAEDWRQAHDLEKAFGNAVHGGDQAEAARLLGELTSIAQRWNSHPDYPPHGSGSAL